MPRLEYIPEITSLHECRICWSAYTLNGVFYLTNNSKTTDSTPPCTGPGCLNTVPVYWADLTFIDTHVTKLGTFQPYQKSTLETPTAFRKLIMNDKLLFFGTLSLPLFKPIQIFISNLAQAHILQLSLFALFLCLTK